MKTLQKLTLVIFSISFILSIASCNEQKEKKQKPNIIFIFADDQCFNTINALGNKEVNTPNLDKLVADGVTFTHTYNMGGWNGAVCIASRTMMNTGRFIWRAHKQVKHLDSLAANDMMWGNMMQKAGYETYMTGKWHIRTKPQNCFNHVVHERPGMPNQSPQGYNRPLSPADTTWEPWHKKYGGYWKGGKHWSEVLKEDAIAFIDSASKKDKPFFMYLAFNAPHDPRQSPKRFVDMYPLDKISVPESFLPEYPYNEAMGAGRNLRDERLAPFPRTKYAVKVNRQEYYAIITHMDYQIGQILDALKKSGKLNNTYIFFGADHGLSCGNHGLMGKQNMFDDSMRPPLIVIGPDLPKDKKVDADVYLQDIMATALDIAGVEKPQYVEFSSLLPLAKGEQTKSNYDAIYGAYTSTQRMIRKDGYKLIIYPRASKALLFDMKKDPLEMNDLSDQKEYSAKVNELFKELLQLQEQMDDTLDLKPLYKEIAQS